MSETERAEVEKLEAEMAALRAGLHIASQKRRAILARARMRKQP